MAYLEISVGPITQQITANDTAAQRVLEGFLDTYGYDRDSMTAVQEAQAVLAELRKFLQESAQAREITVAVETAREGVIADPPTFNSG